MTLGEGYRDRGVTGASEEDAVGVRVRLFAALREEAGTGEVELEAGLLPVLLGELRERHGERFAEVLAMSSVLVDGTATPRDAHTPVEDGAELALLPPVSGGAAGADRRRRSCSGPVGGEATAPRFPSVFTAALEAAAHEA